MKKFGFTLAEVLITLGIIGVVAALTAPALVKNSGQAKIGPTLAKFVNTFETATEQMMTDENISKLSSIGAPRDILEKLSKYMIMSYIDENKYYTVNVDGENYNKPGYSYFTSKTNGYILKDGSFITFIGGSDITKNFFKANYSPKGAYKGNVGACLFYDINGVKGKNIAGKEVFAFIVDDSGVLIPFGSNMHKYLYGEITSGSSSTDMKEDMLKGFSYTGVIADNNWKADY